MMVKVLEESKQQLLTVRWPVQVWKSHVQPLDDCTVNTYTILTGKLSRSVLTLNLNESEEPVEEAGVVNRKYSRDFEG